MRGYVSVPLPSLSGGINRFEREAQPNQAVSGEDVINLDGELQRRESFTTIAAGVPHHFPKGAVFVATDNGSGGSFADARDGTGNFSSTNIRSFYIGAYDKFDGVEWGTITAHPDGTPVGSHPVSLRVWYSTKEDAALTWTEIPHFKDTTILRCGNYMSTLCKDGQITFHADKLTGWETWTPAFINESSVLTSDSLYWVRLDVWDLNTGASAYIADDPGVSGVLQLSQPGIRVFELNPVNGIFPLRLGDKNLTVVCNDRQKSGGATKRRPHEPGAQVGVVTNELEPTRVQRLVEDEGTGVYGTITWPLFTDSGSTAGAASGPTLGTANRLQKSNPNYKWLYDPSGSQEPIFGQFRGSTVAETLIPQTTYSATTLKFLKTAVAGEYREFDHCRLRVTAVSGSGNTVGHEREITRTTEDSTYTYITVYDAFPATPNANDRFAIIRPHARAIINGEDYEVHEHDVDDGDDEIRLVNGGGTTGKYARSPSTAITNKTVHFELSRELRWSMAGGFKYSGVYNKMNRTLVFTNGNGALLEYDGRRVRKMPADTDSEWVKKVAGEIEGKGDTEESVFTLHVGNQFLPSPPKGRYLASYKGHIMVADPDTNIIYYSWLGLPYIWPIGNRTQVQDSFNNRITGMTTLNDKLVVFTATQIFELGPFNADGKLFARPSSQGIGFVSHWSAQRISMSGQTILLGVASDGVYAYNGTEPVAVLDDWSRLLEKGVNQSKLHHAVAAVSQTKNRYYVAVPSAGSETNDKILVFDYFRKAWWVWSAPFGVSFMTTDFDEGGRERVLFGTNDGHVQVLTEGDTDDGQAITGTVRGASIAPFGEREGSLVAALVDVGDMGSADTLTVSSYLDKQETAKLAKTLSVNDRQATFGVAYWDQDAAADADWADGRFLEKRINQPYKARGNKFQLELSGTSRWKARGMTLLARVLERRGR